jgi:pimeloyl-ACP methyl ester carboxylesterase
MREFSFQATDVVLSCVEGPASGPPFLLLHGLFDRWEALRPIAEALSEPWYVSSFDMRGHGESGRVEGEYLPQCAVHDAADFLCARFDEPVVIFGHSAGGLVALACAAEHPARVRAVINGDLFCSSTRLASLIQRPGSIAFHKKLQMLAGHPASQVASSDLASHIPEASRSIWAETISLLDPNTLNHHAQGDGLGYMEAIDTDAILSRVRCPVLLVSGDIACGAVTIAEDVDYAYGLLADARHVRLDGVGHDLGLFSTREEPLLGAINEFLDSL